MDYKLKETTKFMALKKCNILKFSMYFTLRFSVDGGLFFNFYFSITMTFLLSPHISFYFHEKLRVRAW
jgi:hypothetical protein